MKVRMLKSLPGSEDGIHVQDYVAGEEYEMGEALAGAFMGCGAAVAVEVVAPQLSEDANQSAKTKKSKGPSENK